MSDRKWESAVCAYCGLALPGWNRRVPDRAASDPAVSHDAADRPPNPAPQGEAAQREPEYCCLGCKLAAAITSEQGAEGQARWTLTRLGLAIFFSMNVMVFTLALWTQDVYHSPLEAAPPTATSFHQLLRYLCLLFAVPVMLLLAGPLVESAWDQWRRRSGWTDLLLIAGVFAAFAYSLFSVLRGHGHVYFEVACMVLVFVTLGRWLEATGKLKTTSALRSLEKLLPDRVRVVRDGRTVEVPAGEVVAGDTLRVMAGERIAVDGCVVRNEGAVDPQAVTGESHPVLKRPGDRVLSGSLNLDGDLWIEASSAAGKSTLQQVIAAVEQAAARGDRYQRLADRLAAWFLPGVLVLSLTTLAVHGWNQQWQEGMLAALAVVLIACPCALGLATPMALWAALGRACQGQILFREGDALTRLAEARTIFFDKTGTLSTGRAEVHSLHVDPATANDEVLRVAAALAEGNAHPLSESIARYTVPRSGLSTSGGAGMNGLAAVVSDVRSLPGRGVRGMLAGGEPVFLGSRRWMEELKQSGEVVRPEPSEAAAGRRGGHPRFREQDDLSRVYLAWGGRIRACFTLREELREEAAEALRQLRQLGCHVEILSGDEGPRVAALADELGVAGRGDLLPDAKLQVVEGARSGGRVVVMVGDGINDAPALAAANIGVALGSGTDISRQSADVCLLAGDLRRLAWAIQLGQRTARTIRWNLLWAFGYNTAGIALAATGLLNPILAAAAMVGSSLLVVTNSLRLAAFDTEPAGAAAAESPAPGLSPGERDGESSLNVETVAAPPMPRGTRSEPAVLGGRRT